MQEIFANHTILLLKEIFVILIIASTRGDRRYMDPKNVS